MQKIQRRKEYFLIHKLGAWDTDLAIIQNFFPDGDVQKEPLVSKIEAKSFLIAEAGLSMKNLGRLKEANTAFAIEGARKTGRQDIEAESLIELARIRIEQGKYPEAESVINQALRICQRCGYRLYEANCYNVLSQIYLKTTRSKEAKGYQTKAHVIAQETGYSFMGVKR
ncbi:MAG: tetratricopeptide repeat protein [bacterium]|nr:tetratricopeptide repeat protein [bacterium]